MAALMTLPTELLCQILEEVGGGHLRRGAGAAARLTISRQWYAAAHPVYLSGLGTTDIKVHGHNLDELDDKYGLSGLRALMHKNTKSLRLRFLGHWWDVNAAATYDSEDEDGNSVSSSEAQNNPPFDFTMPENQALMERWRDEQLTPRINALFEDLANFSVLDALCFEASSDPGVDGLDGPHWNYLYQSTIQRLLQNVSILPNLSSFTLDVCGMRDGLCEIQPGTHLCENLAAILPQVANVRLRLPTTCSSIFRIPQTPPQSIRLKTLILKIHLPTFANTTSPISKCCAGAHRFQNSRYLYQYMTSQSPSLLRQLAAYRGQDLSFMPEAHGMTGFRISYADPNGSLVATVDCLTKRYVYLPESFFTYEDDGSPCWYELEPGRMLEGPEFIPRF